MFDYPHLETLWAVQDQGTFEKAAKKLKVTRSAISQKMKWLEERWGAPLISRKPVKTTTLGNKLCRHLEHVRLLETKLQLNHGHLFDTSEIDPISIELMFHNDLIPTGLLEQLVTLSDQQNDIFINTAALDETMMRSRMQNGDACIAISASWWDNPLYQNYHLGKQTFKAISNADFANQFFDINANLKTLHKAPNVAHNSAADLGSRFLTQLGGDLCQCNSDTVPSLYSIMNACLDGKAWAMVPTPLVQNHIHDGRLIDLCPGESLNVDIYLYVLRSLQSVVPQVTDLINAAAAEFLRPVAEKKLQTAG